MLFCLTGAALNSLLRVTNLWPLGSRSNTGIDYFLYIKILAWLQGLEEHDTVLATGIAAPTRT